MTNEGRARAAVTILVKRLGITREQAWLYVRCDPTVADGTLRAVLMGKRVLSSSAKAIYSRERRRYLRGHNICITCEHRKTNGASRCQQCARKRPR